MDGRESLPSYNIIQHHLTPVFLQSQIEDMLALDMRYLASRPQPVAPWGKQKPHEYVSPV